MLTSLTKFVSVSATATYDPNSLEALNVGLIQVAQALKDMLTRPGLDVRTFADHYPDPLRHHIRKSAQSLQDSAKKVIQSVRQVNAEKTDNAQRTLHTDLLALIRCMKSFFFCFEDAEIEEILKDSQNLSKCLSSLVHSVKASADSALVHSLTSSASSFVLQWNIKVKAKALSLPDREVQSLLSKCCSSIAILTSDVSRQSLAISQDPAEGRALALLDEKYDGIQSEFQKISSLLKQPISDLYMAQPDDVALEELRSRSLSSIEMILGILNEDSLKAFSPPSIDTLPLLMRDLFDSSYLHNLESVKKVLEVVTIMQNVTEKILAICKEGADTKKHKVIIFGWALEYHLRYLLLSTSCFTMESVTPDASPLTEKRHLISLPFSLSNASNCFLQLVMIFQGMSS